MAKLRRSNRKIEKPGSVGCSGIFLLLVANLQFVGELFAQFCCFVQNFVAFHCYLAVVMFNLKRRGS